MYDPITISNYGKVRQQEILREAEAYWQAKLRNEEQDIYEEPQRQPAIRTPLRRVAHLFSMLLR